MVGSGPTHRSGPGIGRSLGLMGSASAVAFAAGIVRQKLFAVYLGPSGLGLYGVLASLFELLGVLVLLGVPAGLLREASASLARGRPDQVGYLVRRVRVVLMALAAALVAGAFLFGGQLSERFDLPGAWILILTLGLPAVVLAATSEALLNAHGAIRRLASSKVTTTLLSLAATAALVISLGLQGSMLQIVAGAWIAALVTWLALRGVRSGAPASGGAEESGLAGGALKAVFALGLAQIVMHGAANLNLFLFRSILVLGEGEAAAGLYQGTMGLSRQYTAAFSAALYVYAYPRLSRHAGDPGAVGRELAEVLRFVMAIGIPVALVLLAGRDVLVDAVFTAEFRPMIPLMAWSLAVDPFQIGVLVLAFTVLATSSPVVTLVLALLFEAIHFTAFVWGTSAWGVQGAVGAYGVAAAAGTLAYGVYLSRRGALGPSAQVYGRVLLGAAVVGLGSQLPLTGVGRSLSIAVAAAWVLYHRTEIQAAFRA